MSDSSFKIHYQSQVESIQRKDLSGDSDDKRACLQKHFKDIDPRKIMGLKGEDTVDLQTSIPDTWSEAQLVMWGDKSGLEILRHSMAHVLAQAVKRLYLDRVQVTIGPVIAEGFYYDFKVDEAFTPDDLPAIEKEMKKILKERIPVIRKEHSRADAISFFKSKGETFKVEIVEDLPEDVVISVYEQGDFIDLCRGPHVGTTNIGKIGFGLTGVSAAYWRGDSQKATLSRIYGTAFFTPDEYKEFKRLKDEAKRRDHRILGPQMDLFSIHQESPGQVLWHPRGVQLNNTLRALIRQKLKRLQYIEIETPQVWSDVLWKRSGHYDHYKENMFFCDFEREDEDKKSTIRYGIKPMNCPGAAIFYNSKKRSYRELPLRVSEFGKVFRYEPSGVLHGLMRVRGFVQDDAHVFCRIAQVKQEVTTLVNLVKELYTIFDFKPPQFVLSTRPQDAMGDPAIWKQAEDALTAVLDESKVDYTVSPGDGAFYGPKIDFNLLDALNRVWQLGTIQLDFFLPERFECQAVNEKGEQEQVVVIHRAVLGSLERFLGICIEHYAGKFPVWLAPMQVKLIPISEQYETYLDAHVVPLLENGGIRFEKDYRNEKIGYKIRENQKAKVPFLIIAGQKEMEAKTVSIRDLQGNEHQSVDLVTFLKENKWSVEEIITP
jgi:threonyl-tRNA synthetase